MGAAAAVGRAFLRDISQARNAAHPPAHRRLEILPAGCQPRSAKEIGRSIASKSSSARRGDFWRVLRKSDPAIRGRFLTRKPARILAVIEREKLCSLHVFFGNVAVHLLPLLRRMPVPVIVSFHGSDVAGSMASASYADAVAALFELATVVPCRSEQLVSRVVQTGLPRDQNAPDARGASGSSIRPTTPAH